MSEGSTHIPDDDAVIVISSILDAPRDIVWTAFTTPEHVKNWYGGHGYSNPVCEMDVRPGGRWRHVMRLPDGMEIPLEFVFVEVVKPEKLSWRDVDYGKPDVAKPTSLNTMTFEDLGKRTRSTFVARFSSLSARTMAISWGFTSVMAEGDQRMRAVLEKLKQAASR
jgi:uncharacterized protein YndB with AHSA1/START domain